MTTDSHQSRLSKNTVNLILDIGLLLMALVLYEPHASGIVIHEWLGIVMAAVLLVHILLHWNWIAAVTRHFFSSLRGRSRLSYLLSAAIFVGFTAILFSGLMISQSVLPLFGMETAEGGFWRWLHSIAADITFGLVALHIALRWQWLVNSTKRYLKPPEWGRQQQTAVLKAQEPIERIGN